MFPFFPLKLLQFYRALPFLLQTLLDLLLSLDVLGFQSMVSGFN
jgi:hypothetical protein